MDVGATQWQAEQIAFFDTFTAIIITITFMKFVFYRDMWLAVSDCCAKMVQSAAKSQRTK